MVVSANIRRSRTPAAQRIDTLFPGNIEKIILEEWLELLEDFDPEHVLIEQPEILLPALIKHFIVTTPNVDITEINLEGKLHRYQKHREEIERLFHASQFEVEILESELFKRSNERINKAIDSGQLKLKDDMRNRFAVAYIGKVAERRFSNLNASGLTVLSSLNLLPFKTLMDKDTHLYAHMKAYFSEIFSGEELVEAVDRFDEYRKSQLLDSLVEIIDIYLRIPEVIEREIKYLQEEKDALAARKRGELQEEDFLIATHAKLKNKVVENQTVQSRKQAKAEESAAARQQLIEETNLAIEAAATEERAALRANGERRREERLRKAEERQLEKKALDLELEAIAREIGAENRTHMDELVEAIVASRTLALEEMKERLEAALNQSQISATTSMALIYVIGSEVEYVPSLEDSDFIEKIKMIDGKIRSPQDIWFQMVQDYKTIGFEKFSQDSNRMISGPVQFLAKGLLARSISIAAECLVFIDVLNHFLNQAEKGIFITDAQINAVEELVKVHKFGTATINDALNRPDNFEIMQSVSSNIPWEQIVKFEENSKLDWLDDEQIAYLSEILCIPKVCVLLRATDNKDVYEQLVERRPVRTDEVTTRFRNVYGFDQTSATSVLAPHDAINLSVEALRSYAKFLQSHLKEMTSGIEDINFTNTDLPYLVRTNRNPPTQTEVVSH